MPSFRSRALFAVVSALSLSNALVCQLAPVFLQSFVDTVPGGTGNIGVTQDEVNFEHFVVAFQNPQNVHRFDLFGTPVGTFTATSCSPAQPTPNDITYDPFTGGLWLVDNNGNTVLRMSRQGVCLGGWPVPVAVTNPVGICVDRNTGTLFISYTGAVMQCDTDGNLLGGGFSFVPPTGSSILSGITYVPATDHFLISQSSGTQIYEVDRSGALLSTTPMAPFGLVNIQGLHYNPVLQRLIVVDNSLSTTFLFSLPFCNGTVVHRGLGCVDGGGARLVIGATGCADLGAALNLASLSTPSPIPMLFAGGVSDTVVSGASLPIDLGLLGAPGCWLYTSSEAVLSAPMVGNTALLTLNIPNTGTLQGVGLFFQAAKFDPTLTSPLPLATSNYVQITVF